jgi:lactaldehyde reductase
MMGVLFMAIKRMVLNETSYFGKGAVSVIPEEAKARGFKKAFVTSDKDLVKFKVTDKVLEVLVKAGIPYELYDNIKPNPTIENVQTGVKSFNASGADFIVAIGGGSSIDTAKAIGIIAANPEYADVRSLEGVAPTKKPCVPIIAVPTTSGTAAEVTINYVITDVEKTRKFVCVDPHDIPVLAVIDPEMMVTMPKGLAAATGMDALTHAIEGYITKGAWELSDMFEIKAIAMISRSLRDSVLKVDIDAREEMSVAQYVAGMAFSNVGLGLVHGMAHTLSAYYDTPHGVACALLLPYIMEYNADAAGAKYKDIAQAMGVDVSAMTPEQYKKAAVDAVRKLSIDVGIPQKLNEVGARKEDIQQLAASALKDACTPGNPKDATVADIEALFRKAF